MKTQLETEASKNGFARYANRQDWYRTGARMSCPYGHYIAIAGDDDGRAWPHLIRVYRETFLDADDNPINPPRHITVATPRTIAELIAWIDANGEHRPGLPAFSNSWD